MLLSELWNACALPWKLVAIEGGSFSSFVACWIAVTASPIGATVARSCKSCQPKSECFGHDARQAKFDTLESRA